MPSNKHSQDQPTSSREPFTHSVSDVKGQPLCSAPCGQVLAPDIALFGDVLIWPEYLRGREKSKYPRPERNPTAHVTVQEDRRGDEEDTERS